MVEIKVFNRWSMEGIEVKDVGLKEYVNLEPKLVPKTGARNAKVKFRKSKIFIVERLINKLMVPGHKSKKHSKSSYYCTGKGTTVYKLVEVAFGMIERETKTNPIKVFVQAVENAAPREEIVAIEYGGARYPKATECGPQRRIDLAVKNMVQGAYQKSFGKKTTSAEALAQEIMDAYSMNAGSNAISKKQEIERQADASR